MGAVEVDMGKPAKIAEFSKRVANALKIPEFGRHERHTDSSSELVYSTKCLGFYFYIDVSIDDEFKELDKIYLGMKSDWHTVDAAHSLVVNNILTQLLNFVAAGSVKFSPPHGGYEEELKGMGYLVL